MLHVVHSLATTTKAAPDSLTSALADWFECGLFAGLRLTEWSQSSRCSNPLAPQLNHRMETRAFCLRDVRFAGSNNCRLSAIAASITSATSIAKCWITFRTQKNGCHGEERLVTQNSNPTGHCFVRSMLRIISRFLRIHGPDHHNTPLATYQTSDCGQSYLITSNNIQKIIQHQTAKRTSLLVCSFLARRRLCYPPFHGIHGDTNKMAPAMAIRCLHGIPTQPGDPLQLPQHHA
jgi:hypothetical protein